MSRNRDLLSNGILSRKINHCSEVRSKSLNKSKVVRLAHKYVFSVVVDQGELSHEITYVCADAVVVELAHVDGDSHGTHYNRVGFRGCRFRATSGVCPGALGRGGAKASRPDGASRRRSNGSAGRQRAFARV